MPRSGIAPAERLLGFNRPSTIIDMTRDVPYESKWLPLKTAGEKAEIRQRKLDAMARVHARKNNASLLDHIADQERAHFAKFHYDKAYVYQILFEDYMDQGETMQKAKKPQELVEDEEFWELEKQNARESRICINKLKGL